MFHVEHFLKICFMKISGRLVDIHKRNIYPAEITVSQGRIQQIEEVKKYTELFILPGLIDAHIHIESSMLTPGAFGLKAIEHGTTGVVSDPHEIANVLGLKGIEFMIGDSKKSPVKFWFGAPSCVPATDFETSGAKLTHEDIDLIMKRDDIKYLSEMMNFPGVIYGDKEVMAKIEVAKKYKKPIDGHAPGLKGDKLEKYVSAGISTDHECSTIEEAKEKISLGMKIMIREGSAARNLNALKELYRSDPDMIMLCSDDLHPEMLATRHINKLIAVLISEGYNIFDVIRSATINPANHYSLDAGLLRKGDRADFIIVDDLRIMNILESWINGSKVFDRGRRYFTYKPGIAINNFKSRKLNPSELVIRKKSDRMRVFEALDGELLTKEIFVDLPQSDIVTIDINKDILKIVVKDRYMDNPPAIGFVRGFGMKNGAFASSVAHDSHNIICVGTNDEDISTSINEIIRKKGGLAVSTGGTVTSLQLNIGGIMTTRTCDEVAGDYGKLNEMVKSLGCRMAAPFMTLSFMALLVIPEIKISDRGLFDVNKFLPVSLFI